MAAITKILVLCSALVSQCALVATETIYWEGHVENGDYIVKTGNTLVLRGSNTVNGSLQIASGGSLTVDDLADTELTVGNIEVFGEFRIGTPGVPYKRKARIELACGSHFLASDDRRKSVAVRENGTIAIYGSKGFSSQTWTRLRDTAHAGDSCLPFDLPRDWEIGDEIVLPSTDFDPHQAEKRTITGVTASCVMIDRPLQYMHYGRVTEGVDERGEVALLTRSIAFHGCEEQLDGAPDVGGHMIFHNSFRRVQIQGVELQNFGQGDQLGRYPFHFHLCGLVPADTVLRSNSIHNSHFRAITVHGTQGVRVEDNVAFNITGHAVMLEDGAERDNVIQRNLVVLVTEKLTHVRLGSDARVALSAFYITNPANTITDNVVAGVEGSAFWIHTRLEVKGQSYVTGKYDGVHPFKLPLGDMSRNAAHSVEVGFNVDSPDLDAFDYPQQRYSPAYTYMPETMPVISDFTVHHSRQGAWLRMLRVVLDNWIVGDVTEGVQILTRGDTSSQSIENYVTNSRFVGSTANRGNLVVSRWQFINYLENRSDSAVDRTENARMAITLYDGPMYITNCTFTRWYSQGCLNVINPAIGTRLFNTFAMSTSIVAKDLTFEKTDYKFFVSDREGDGGKSTSMVDSRGDISGWAGATLLPDWGLYHTSHCYRSSEWRLACPHRYTNLDIVSLDTDTDPTRFGAMVIHRIVGDGPPPSLAFAGQYIPASGGWLYHPIVSPGASYLIQFRDHTPEKLKLVFSSTKMNDVFRIAVAYPPVTRISAVVNQNGVGLVRSTSAASCTDCFWFDETQSLLWLVVKERADLAGPDAACPPSGCLGLQVTAVIPKASGVADSTVSSMLSTLERSEVDTAWLDTRFAQESVAQDSADNMDWCQVDDPCLHAMDEGNRKLGILAYTESPCNGVGCYTDTCRYCKLSISSANVPFGPCPYDPGNSGGAAPKGTCAEFVSIGDIESGIEVIEDASCSALGQGCINSQCRFCRTPKNTGSAFLPCSSVGLAPPASTLGPTQATLVPLPATPSTGPAPTNAAMQSPQPVPAACLSYVPSGDQGVGIGAIEDVLCEFGGLGCFTNNCRYCRTSSTPQSKHLLPCSRDAIRNAVASASNGASRDPSNACLQFVSPGDLNRGLTAAPDASCQSGGLGCFSAACRYCSVDGSPDSTPYLPCAAISSASPDQSMISAAVTEDPCRGLVSPGDVDAGITAVTEIACGSAGGVGCVTDSCRYCKTRTTAASAHLNNCTEAVSSTIDTTADRLFLESVRQPPTVVDAIDTCSYEVSLEENVAGIFGFTDFSCSDGGIGCFGDSCRYCRTKDAVDIFQDDGDVEVGDTVDDFVMCPMYVVSSSMGGIPFQETDTLSCATSVSFGDSQSGISAYADETCSTNTGGGCFALAPCRYCKYRETRRSSSLSVCPFTTASKISESTPCTEIPRILDLPSASAIHDPRCSAASLNLTGCIAYTVCRLCKLDDGDDDARTQHLPPCSSLNATTNTIALSSAASNPSSSAPRSALSWSSIIEIVVGVSCAIAVAAIVVHKRQRRRQEPDHLQITTPHHLPRPHDRARASVARVTRDADIFLI